VPVTSTEATTAASTAAHATGVTLPAPVLGALWAFGAIFLGYLAWRVLRTSSHRPTELVREMLRNAGRVALIVGIFLLVAVGLQALGTVGGVVGTIATATFHALLFAVAGVFAAFLARQFLAPPWWRLNAWNPDGFDSALFGSVRDILSWILEDARAAIASMRRIDQIVVLVGVPALTIDLCGVVGTTRLLTITYFALFVCFVALVVALFTANRIPRVLMSRLQELRHVARAIAQGDLSARAGYSELGDYEELGELIADINSMARSLEARESENEALKGQLQQSLHYEQERATRDPLTSLRNHRYFQESLHAEIYRCARTGSQVTIAIIDLDNFKQVNDRFGHQEGDAVLLRVTQLLANVVRPYDLACRLGGEEFGVIFPETGAAEAKVVLDRVMDAMHDAGPQGARCSFSGGIATYPLLATDQATLYHHADMAAYAAKMAGKAQTKIYDPTTVVDLDSEERQKQQHRDAVLKTAKTLVSAVDSKDPNTRNHSENVGRYCMSLGQALGLDQETCGRLYLAGILHDVGKIGVADTITLKAGRLTDAEYAQMKHHVELGFQIVQNAGMDDIAVAVRHHHERWDGNGYPFGLVADDIPLASRIILVAEAFDVMTTDHVYRRAMTAEQALGELQREAGSRFDPNVVHAMVQLVARGLMGDGGLADPTAALHADATSHAPASAPVTHLQGQQAQQLQPPQQPGGGFRAA
jgi:diguanylate cyclase (GGDEF)-like protein